MDYDASMLPFNRIFTSLRKVHAHKCNDNYGKGFPLMKLLDLVRDDIHNKNYSVRTEQAYIKLVRQSIMFHGKYHPKDMGEKGIAQYLYHISVSRGP